MEENDGKKRKEGPSMFGTFIAIIELAAKCEPRGDLLKSDGTPHTFESIGRICRIIPSLIDTTISFCVNPLKWIQIIELTTNCEIVAGNCQDTPVGSSILFNSIPFNSSSLKGTFEKAKYGKRSIIFIPPTIEEMTKYFTDNGFPEELARRAFNGYAAADWHDSYGNKIKNWKQKAQHVWFKPEAKIKPEVKPSGPQQTPGLDAYYQRQS
jgi:hypothetical protein